MRTQIQPMTVTERHGLYVGVGGTKKSVNAEGTEERTKAWVVLHHQR